MQFYDSIKTKLFIVVALSFSFLLSSCGSYQYVGYDNDGIYSDGQTNYEEPKRVETQQATTENNSTRYSESFFDQKARQYSDIPDDERIIFTDIDSYVGDYSEENQEEQPANRNAGWGQANDNVTINYIDYGWGFNDPWLWNGAWGWRWGWNRWGWNNWGWNAGFGWGWNAGFGWGWNNWGWGFNNFWCPPGFNGYYVGNRGLAFQNGRRGTNVAYGNRNSIARRNGSSITRRNGSSITRGNNSNSVRRGTSTIRRNNNGTRSNYRGNSTRNGNRSSSVRPRSNSRSSTINRSRSNSSRMSSPSRSRSSSSMRSSRGSFRSSGARSSSRGGSGRRR